MQNKLLIFGAVLISMIALFGGAEGECSFCGGGIGAWSGQAWLEDALSGSSGLAAGATGVEAGETAGESNGSKEEMRIASYEASSDVDDDIRSWSISAQDLRKRLNSEPKPVIAYVSNTPPHGSYITGSIQLPSKGLLHGDSSLKSPEEMAAVLGRAGVTEKDEVVIYGDCFSCGDLTLVFWIMKYLGHRDVAILRGSEQDWSASGLSLSGATSAMAETVYTPSLRPDLLADYESVAAGVYQVVDARTPDQFNLGHIPGARNIDYHWVMEGSWLKSDSALAGIFADLDEDKPVAVYTKNGGTASIVWYALELQGHDARLYTWNDWLSHGG